jgi:hypothetical protein
LRWLIAIQWDLHEKEPGDDDVVTTQICCEAPWDCGEAKPFAISSQSVAVCKS